MPQYAVLQSHPPDNCPGTNKQVREFYIEYSAKWPALKKELGIKTVLDIHLDPAHKVLTIYEAPNAEVVRDFLLRGGFLHLYEMEFFLVTPMEELMKHLNEFPILYH